MPVRTFKHPAYALRYLREDKGPPFALSPIASTIEPNGVPAWAKRLAIALKFRIVSSRGDSRAWWVGHEKAFTDDFTDDFSDVAYRIGAGTFARRQEKRLLRHDNFGISPLPNGMRPIPRDVFMDLLDFGSLAGAFVHKILTGKCVDYLEEYGWNFPNLVEKRRAVVEQLIYLEVLDDIANAANSIGLDY